MVSATARKPVSSLFLSNGEIDTKGDGAVPRFCPVPEGGWSPVLPRTWSLCQKISDQTPIGTALSFAFPKSDLLGWREAEEVRSPYVIIIVRDSVFGHF
jgi:hypothetical protein